MKKQKKRPKSKVNTKSNKAESSRKQIAVTESSLKKAPCQTFYNNSSQNQTVNINIYMDPSKMKMLPGSQSVEALGKKKSKSARKTKN